MSALIGHEKEYEEEREIVKESTVGQQDSNREADGEDELAAPDKQVKVRGNASQDCKQESSLARPVSGNNLTLNTNNSNNNIVANNNNTDIERRYRPQKYCAVCGDKAIACNFNAVTCESCKAFFRRNAFKEQRLKCLFDNRCIIDRVTRRFCSKCRLLKCLQIGMKREWILTDEQKQIKRVKILQNRQFRQRASSSPSTSEKSPLQTDQHTRASKNRQVGGAVETRDAAVSCPADLGLDTGYCSLAFQCQFCSSRLTTSRPLVDCSREHISMELAQVYSGISNGQAILNAYSPSDEAAAQLAQCRVVGGTVSGCCSPLGSSHTPMDRQLNQLAQPMSPAGPFAPNLHVMTPPGGIQAEMNLNNVFGLIRSESQVNPMQTEPTPLSPTSHIPDSVITKNTDNCVQNLTNLSGSPNTSANSIKCLSEGAKNVQSRAQDSVISCQTEPAYLYKNLPMETPPVPGQEIDANPNKSDYVNWNGSLFLEPATTEAEVKMRIDRLNFSQSERRLIEEVIVAMSFIFDVHQAPEYLNHDSINDVVYICDASLRRLIKNVRLIEAFKLLTMDDQIILLKSACFKILLLRSAFHYIDDMKGWSDLKSGKIFNLELLKDAKKSLVYERHKEMIESLPRPLRKDRLVIMIMTLIILFDLNTNLRHASSIELDNMIYLSLLRKYLVLTQPDPLTKYGILVDSKQLIEACSEEYNVFFSKDIQLEQITPLLVEIFDISIEES